MNESLFLTAVAGDSPSDSRCSSLSIRQGMQETLRQTADAGDSIKQGMQETLYQTADAGNSIRQRMQETLY